MTGTALYELLHATVAFLADHLDCDNRLRSDNHYDAQVARAVLALAGAPTQSGVDALVATVEADKARRAGRAQRSGLAAFPARVLIDELIHRFGADDTARQLGLSDAGELLTFAIELDKRRPHEAN